jgi:diguanylate cyclase (GGDEF)-like protein
LFARAIPFFLLSLFGAITIASAQSLEVAVARLDATSAGPSDADVVRGAHDAWFRDVPGGQVRMSGGAERRHWLRLAFDLPGAGDAAREAHVLNFDRIPLDRLAVFMPQPGGGHRVLEAGFFAPAAGAGLSPDSFAFALPPDSSGRQVVYVAVEGVARMNLTPRVESESGFREADRRIGVWLGATYAAIIVLMLSALSLFLALRDRAYAHFAALTLGLLFLLMAVNGHLYLWPGLEWIGWWRNHGLYALGLVCCALALGFTREFLGLPQLAPTQARWLDRARWALFGIAAVCVSNPLPLAPVLHLVTLGAAFATALLVAAASIGAWRRGEPLARAYCLVWLILSAAIASRASLSLGWIPQQALTLYGFQVAVAFCLFLISIGLADRVMEFRRQRDQVRQLKAQTDASLHVEQVRRQFIEGLREQSRQMPAGSDLEWVAFRRVLASLAQLLPQQGAAIVAFGYNGNDFSLSEPMDRQPRFAAMVDQRVGALKSLCRTRKPQQLELEEGGLEDPTEARPTRLAVVPMPLPAPAWGAMLIERTAEAPFSAEELKLAAEFLALAVAASDEAASQAELRRKAEIDPLTGACNRRSGDALMRKALQRALAERRPFSLLFVDLDHFKQVNDQHGHAVGDECLRRAAATIRRELQDGDVLVRHGGEEFLVVLPGRTPDAARLIGERIRHAMLQQRVEHEGLPIRFSVSIGVAGRQAGEEDPDSIVERADKALYRAKRNGRNQVEVAQVHGYGSADDEETPPVAL